MNPMDLPLFLLLVVVTSALVMAGWVVFGSLYTDRTLGETVRDLWETFFGGHSDDLPNGGDLNRKLEQHEMTTPQDNQAAQDDQNSPDERG
ncbi:MAG: hypothetical protein ACLFTK_09785 [Anaerolineales bacterium]